MSRALKSLAPTVGFVVAMLTGDKLGDELQMSGQRTLSRMHQRLQKLRQIHSDVL
jgi:hypothetical protein